MEQDAEVHLAGLPADLLERCLWPLKYAHLLRCAQVPQRILEITCLTLSLAGALIDQSMMKHLPLVTHLPSLALSLCPSSLFFCSHAPSVLLLSFLALSPPGHSLSASHR
jgi:hypothetical protein